MENWSNALIPRVIENRSIPIVFTRLRERAVFNSSRNDKRSRSSMCGVHEGSLAQECVRRIARQVAALLTGKTSVGRPRDEQYCEEAVVREGARWAQNTLVLPPERPSPTSIYRAKGRPIFNSSRYYRWEAGASSAWDAGRAARTSAKDASQYARSNASFRFNERTIPAPSPIARLVDTAPRHCAVLVSL